MEDATIAIRLPARVSVDADRDKPAAVFGMDRGLRLEPGMHVDHPWWGNDHARAGYRFPTSSGTS